MEMAESKRWQSYGDGRVKEIAELRRWKSNGDGSYGDGSVGKMLELWIW